MHVSWTSHLVPTTVAALCLPFVVKRPLPSPHSRRFLTFFLAIDALPLALQPVSFSVPDLLAEYGGLIAERGRSKAPFFHRFHGDGVEPFVRRF